MVTNSDSNISLLSRDKEDKKRRPPVNYEAEQQLLGALLANNLAFDRINTIVREEHFADPVHGRIFAAIAKMIERNQLADPIQLGRFFEDDPALQEVGGADYLNFLADNVISLVNITDYAQTIFDLFVRRQLINVGEVMVEDAFSSNIDFSASEQIEKAESSLYQIAETGEVDKGLQPFKNVLVGALNNAEAAYQRDTALVGTTTGLKSLDRLLGGLVKSDLLILAGRPSMGKTALATNIAFNAARKGGANIAFFSLEMSAEQLAARMLAEQSGVPSDKIRKGEVTDSEFSQIVDAARDLEDITYFIDDTPAIQVATMRTKCRRLKRQQGLDLVVVDYLQLMRGSSSSNDNRVQEISEITRGLKALAKELDVPVVALSQLSRQVENREDKRPQLSDLRESGSIEQDADIVMFIFREEYYLQKAEPLRKPDESEDKYSLRYEGWRQRLSEVHGQSLVIVAKQRHGPTGDVKLTFDGATTRFSDYADPDYLPEQRFN